MTKPIVILDPHWRQMDELFSSADQARLHDQCDVIWGQDAPIPDDVLKNALSKATILIAENPKVSDAVLETAPNLKMVIEVSGAFPDTIDYAACAKRDVEVLSCSPGFRQSVAEMGLGMAIASARSIVAEHQAFGQGREHWLSDNDATDFTLYNADVGIIGFGQIAKELTRLMAPFGCKFRAFDPWQTQNDGDPYGVELTSLDGVLSKSKCLFITAVPTRENKGMIGAAEIAKMPKGALLLLLSRAHLVQMEPLLEAVRSGHIKAAIDVFDQEPLPKDDPMRQMDGLILSPHRAAAVPGGRQLIGAMLLDDIEALMAGRSARRLLKADMSQIASLAGVGDGTQVGDMASKR